MMTLIQRFKKSRLPILYEYLNPNDNLGDFMQLGFSIGLKLVTTQELEFLSHSIKFKIVILLKYLSPVHLFKAILT